MDSKALVQAPGKSLIALNPAHSLESYIQFAHSVPMLTAEQERSYAENLQKHGDIESAQRLIMPHLRFVIKVARGFVGYGLAMADLIQEGNVGLMKAVKRFKPDMGVRLVSFAVHWIKAEIHDFVIKNWRIVKVATTKAQRKLFFNLRSHKKRLGWFSKNEIQEVADALEVRPKDVIEMERRMNSHDTAYDAPAEVGEDDDQQAFAPMHYLPAAEASPEEQVANDEQDSAASSQLMLALKQLDERSQDILQSRWLADQKATLHDLAAKYQVSAERVRQLESAAMKKIKMAIGA